ncbi:tetratricopeptide repeat protein [Hamadaea tsunoensis]|uniref:tetratricopeptide repeat protein n=1 Tax=Hamadaea tsunoensis TaxID=53368 RepID=UPI0003F97C0C|nr:tetratricopeptide repeat protein [Hamadaea tsunoensis]
MTHVDAAYAQGVVIGDGNQVSITVNQAPVQWPVRVNLGAPVADCWQQRSEEASLTEAQRRGGTVVLSGLGGVGKTQLAAAHAQRTWRAGQVQLLVWASAGMPDQIVAVYADAAARVGVHRGESGEVAARRFLEFLAETDRPWLVVLDDLSTPDVLAGWWPPVARAGQLTVVTTRLDDPALHGHDREVVRVGWYTEQQARDYVGRRLRDRAELADEVDELAEDLGRLPIALAQATAYQVALGWSCSRYRQELATRPLAGLTPGHRFLPDGQQATVDATWSISVETADGLTRGLARPLMQLLSLLDPNGIPQRILTSTAARHQLVLAQNPGWMRRWGAFGLPWGFTRAPILVIAPAQEVEEAVACLRRFSLITVKEGRIRMHSLVQRAIREHTPRHDLALSARTAADALYAAWPDGPQNGELAQASRACTVILHRHHPGPLWTKKDGVHPVLVKAGFTLGEAGQVVAARAYFDDLLGSARRHLRSDHKATFVIRCDAALWQGQAGDYTGAAAALEQLVAVQVRVLGRRHPQTLDVRHNLAYWRGAAGDPAGAAEACEQLLADKLRVLGPDHPSTLYTKADLASWRGRVSSPGGAAEAFDELLPAVVRVLGADHVFTLNTRHNVAYWRGRAGDPAGAVAAFRTLLPDQVRVLGRDHSDTLNTRLELARSRGDAGDPAGAAAALGKLLADQRRALGPDHPHTLLTRHELARLRGEAGDPAAAAAGLAKLLPDRERVLGADHVHTRETLQQLAHWRQQVPSADG